MAPARPFSPGPRTTLAPAALRKRPGEHAPLVARLAAGTVVQADKQDGRWLRVRAGNAVGFLARTQVSEDDGGAAGQGPTGWGATRRGENSSGAGASGPPGAATGLYVEVQHDTAALRAEPAAAAAVVAPAARGSRLAIVAAARTSGWLRARDEQGREGWIEQAHVGDGAAAVALGDDDAGGAVGWAARAGAPAVVLERSRPTLRGDLGIGYRSLGMSFASNGTSGLANYLLSVDAPAVDVNVDLGHRLTRRLVVGVDGRVQLSKATGLDYEGPSSPSGTIPFSTLGVDTGLRLGARLRQMFELAVRAGAHYDVFFAEDVDNAALLARERLRGATVGARVDILPPGSRIAVTGRLDVLVAGDRAQTAGLENGTSSTAGALWGGVTLRLQLAGPLSLLAAYDFGRATTEWEGMSVRDPGVTRASRVDRTQLVQLGVSAAL